MLINTKEPFTGQGVAQANEWTLLLRDLEDHGLIIPLEAELLGWRPAPDIQAAVRERLRSGPAAVHALEAIAPCFASDDVIELRALDPQRPGSLSLCGRLGDPAERLALEDFIRDHIGVRNLYVGVNPRRADMAGASAAASGADIPQRRFVVLDFDNKDGPEADPDWARTIQAVQESLDPALVLNSGNGVHVWLPVEPIEGPDAASTSTVKDAMLRIGSDDMSDLPRIVRLPWTPNLPTTSKRARGAVPRLAVPVRALGATAGGPRPAPRSVDALCEGLNTIAQRLALPGKGGRATVSALGQAASRGQRGHGKPHPAPSLDVFRLALDSLPNERGGPLDNRDAWVAFIHASKGAARAAGFEAEAREVLIEWSAQWDGDVNEPARVWDSIHQPDTGWGSVMRILEAKNPSGHAAVKLAAAQEAFARAALDNRAAVLGTGLAPFAGFDPKAYHPRRFLYGQSIVKGFVTVFAAPGGQGKTSVLISQIIAMCSGRNLLGEKPVRPLRVLYHSAEDDLEEAGKRIAAAAAHHGVTPADIGGRLFVTSGRGQGARPISLARMGPNGPEEVPGMFDALSDLALSCAADVIVLDPMAAVHSVVENDNPAMNFLVDLLRQLADRTGAAVVLAHHTSKAAAQDMDGAGAGAVRGASAIVDGARVVRTLVRMTVKEATQFGVPPEQRHRYLRIENAKANLSPAASALWVLLVDVPLHNGQGDWPGGDRIGVAEAWAPPTAQLPSAADLARVQAAVAAAQTPLRASDKSPDWVGHRIARALELDIGPVGSAAGDRTPEQNEARRRVVALIAEGLRDGSLVRQRHRDSNRRRDVDVVVAGCVRALDADLENPAETANHTEAE